MVSSTALKKKDKFGGFYGSKKPHFCIFFINFLDLYFFCPILWGMEYFNFWDRVKAILKAHKITQKKLAAILDIPKTNLSRWIQYKRIPNTYIVYSIAIVLGVTSNYLLGGEESDIEASRFRELKAREALGKIEELAEAILKEVRANKPIGKSASVPVKKKRGKR